MYRHFKGELIITYPIFTTFIKLCLWKSTQWIIYKYKRHIENFRQNCKWNLYACYPDLSGLPPLGMQGSFKTTLHKVFKCTLFVKKNLKSSRVNTNSSPNSFLKLSSKNYLIPQCKRQGQYYIVTGYFMSGKV